MENQRLVQQDNVHHLSTKIISTEQQLLRVVTDINSSVNIRVIITISREQIHNTVMYLFSGNLRWSTKNKCTQDRMIRRNQAALF